jgi:hypothetical protein
MCVVCVYYTTMGSSFFYLFFLDQFQALSTLLIVNPIGGNVLAVAEGAETAGPFFIFQAR